MNKNPCRILLVDDEKHLAGVVARSLRDEGYEVLTAYDGQHALETAAHHNIDLVLLDVIMPGKDGFWVCSELRKRHISGTAPIIFMTARSDVDDRVRGLDMGGNDYLVKPFSMKELKARIRVLLRKNRFAATETEDARPKSFTLEVGPLSLSLETREVRIADTAVKLTPKEFELLHHLMRHAGEILSSSELLQDVWGYPAESNCASLVRWHIKALRNKIEPNPSSPIYIRTVPHHGYVLNPAE